MSELWHSSVEGYLDDVEEIMLKDLESENPELTEMCQYVISSGGKRLRPAVCILSYLLCGGRDVRQAVKVGAAFEIIHSATLIHDDINDQGEVRRGKKALHKQYTISKAIIAGDFMFAMGFRLLANAAPQIVEYIVDASASMGAGEFVQKRLEHATKVTEDDYIVIIRGKTAKLFEAAARSGAAIANASSSIMDALGNFAYEMGLAFQIMDDTLDVVGVDHKTGKRVGTDLMEGKPTLPIIYAMQHPELGDEIKGLFEKKEISEDDVHQALDLIRRTDSVDLCMARARSIAESAKARLSVLPESVYRDALMDMADYVVNRDR